MVFKEDMRGKHQRLYFLDIFNYTKRWEFYLKYAKHVSVQATEVALKDIVRSEMTKDAEGLKKVESMLPLSLPTVHAWMLKAGIKYEKGAASYYTDLSSICHKNKNLYRGCCSLHADGARLEI